MYRYIWAEIIFWAQKRAGISVNIFHKSEESTKARILSLGKEYFKILRQIHMRTEIMKFIKSSVIMLVSLCEKTTRVSLPEMESSNPSFFIAQDKEMNCKCNF